MESKMTSNGIKKVLLRLTYWIVFAFMNMIEFFSDVLLYWFFIVFILGFHSITFSKVSLSCGWPFHTHR
jgi:TB2/DP1, HVA22 family